MVWFFTKDGGKARVSLEFDACSGKYVLELKAPDGTVHCHRFDDFATFSTTVRSLDAQLTHDVSHLRRYPADVLN